MTNPPDLGTYSYNHIEFYELTDDQDNLSWHFIQKRCLHCLYPVCVDSCPIGAIVKFENGPVVVDKNLCVGLQYCGCPFDLLRFEEIGLNRAVKCTFCWNRLDEGQEPACAKTCPPNAIKFGGRDELLAQAHARIQSNPGRYYNHVYGEHEAGGTSIMYLTAVAPEKLGFPTFDSQPLSEEPSPVSQTKIPWGIPAGIAGIIAAVAGLWYFRARRTKGKVKS